MITNIFNTFVRTKASTARIKEVFDSAGDFNGGGEAKKLNGDIEFDNVTFAYPGGSGVPALKNLSFSVKSGQTLAIIGPTGSGKSTVAWLLLRFYDVNDGRILMNGYDIRDLNIETVRRNVAMVPQKPMLFSGSVADNIRWGNKEATDEMLKQAARMAEADFISKMDNGFDSLLGSAGVNVSGGQKQRISIARGIIKNSPVLILDDATSALDAVTEAKVRKNLKDKTGKQTVIIITQRCGTAMSADRILVLDNGVKVGFGTHDQLMKDCEVYRDIYKTQIESSKEA
jgi:ATP-binding cassette subfamily B multidrug efflux pump